MVGVFPPCRRPPERHALGRLGAASHAEMFLATVAWLAWALAHVATVGRGRTRAAGGIQQQRRVAHRGQPRAAHRPKQPRPTVPRLLGAIRPCPDVKWGIVQPPDAEDRTSGGVGGSRGAIPVTRPDRCKKRQFPVFFGGPSRDGGIVAVFYAVFARALGY